MNKPVAVRARDYLTLEDVLDLHRERIHRWGGTQGIRDPGLLEVALYRPQTGYGLQITADNAVAEEFILGLYERREVRFDLLRAWLLENTEAAEGSTS